MSKLRLRFVKENQAVYISHLDLMRTFQRVFIRAGLVIRHSQGFHPHPIMSLALPLPVGQSSVCELLDFETTGAEDPSTMMERLNPWMPAGIRAVDCWEPLQPIRDLALLDAEITFHYDNGIPAGASADILSLLARDQIVIQKRTKHKALADVDIRPMLMEITAEESGNFLLLRALVQAQNPGVNPALLANAVEIAAPSLMPSFVQVHRLALLDRSRKEFR